MTGAPWLVLASGAGRVRHLNDARGRPACSSRGRAWKTTSDHGDLPACASCVRISARRTVQEAEAALSARVRAQRVAERLRYRTAFDAPPPHGYQLLGPLPPRVAAARSVYLAALVHFAEAIEETMLR